MDLPGAARMTQNRKTRYQGRSVHEHKDISLVEDEIDAAVETCRELMERKDIWDTLKEMDIGVPQDLTDSHLECWLVNNDRRPAFLPGDRVRAYVHGRQWTADILDVSSLLNL